LPRSHPFIFGLLALLIVSVVEAKDKHIVIDTQLGHVRGLAGDDSQRFLGLPYAQAPVGSLRWKAPQPLQPSSTNTMLDATKFAPSCLQPDAQVQGLTTSEDCLYLNIFAPQGTTNTSNRPILLWIHGGGGGNWQYGSGSLYLGDTIVDTKLYIIVTINYRLGPFGFLVTNVHSLVCNRPLTNSNSHLLRIY